MLDFFRFHLLEVFIIEELFAPFVVVLMISPCLVYFVTEGVFRVLGSPEVVIDFLTVFLKELPGISRVRVGDFRLAVDGCIVLCRGVNDGGEGPVGTIGKRSIIRCVWAEARFKSFVIVRVIEAEVGVRASRRMIDRSILGILLRAGGSAGLGPLVAFL